MIVYRLEAREENKAWQQYLSVYPNMDEKTFKPFSQFYKKARGNKISKRTTEDILKEAQEIEQKLSKKKGG